MATLTRAFVSREQIDLIASNILGRILPGQTEQDIFVASTVQKYALGARRVVDNGGLPRVFHYARIHPDITAGLGRGRVMLHSDAGVERGVFLGAQTAGAKTVTWTCVGNVAANQYANGFVLLQGGFVREIKSHGAGTAGVVITLTLYDPIPETIAAGRYGLLQHNPYRNVYNKGSVGVHPNAEGTAMGVLPIVTLAGYYVWLQTWGPCGVIASSATLGDVATEFDIRHGMNPGDEVLPPVGHGFQSIGRLLIANAVCWDSENFIVVDLNIRP